MPETASKVNLNTTEQKKNFLNNLSDLILADIGRLGIETLFEPLQKYHEFEKSRLKPGLLEGYLRPYGLTGQDVQIA